MLTIFSPPVWQATNLAIVGHALACADLQVRLSPMHCGAKAPRKLKLIVTQFSHGRSLSVGPVPIPATGRSRPAFAFAPDSNDRPGGRPADLGTRPTKLSDIELKLPAQRFGASAQ